VGVMTYIQSGNIVFKSEEKDTKKIAKSIEEFIENHYTFKVPVLVFSQTELQNVAIKNPFVERENDTTKLHVTFLDSQPKKELLRKIDDEKYQSDEFHVDGENIYLYCPDGYGMTKFSTVFFEKKLSVTATTRNWKTITSLIELMTK
jgi:uncharacterized protein (DUF1697 family)